jgi:hypothetical protein
VQTSILGEINIFRNGIICLFVMCIFLVSFIDFGQDQYIPKWNKLSFCHVFTNWNALSFCNLFTCVSFIDI